MKDELIMDQSRELFTFNKDELIFKINECNQSKLSSHSSQHSGELKQLSEEEIIVKNLTSDFLAFRTKTTKKQYYALSPTYCVIPPNGTQNLSIILYNQSGQKIDPKGHKFKFEGFIISKNEKDENIKNLFHEYIKNGTKVVGNIKKKSAKFIVENDEEGPLRASNNSLGSSNLSNYTVANDKKETLLMDKIQEKEDENLRLSDILENKSEGKIGVDNPNLEKLNNLKREYNQLKEQVENLKRNEELLNKRIYNEKNKKNVIHGSDKFKFKVPEDKDEKIPINKLIGIFIFSILLGFYLVK